MGGARLVATAKSREKNGARRAARFFRRRGKLLPAHPRHRLIGDDEVECLPRNLRESCLAIFRGDDRVEVACEIHLEDLADNFLVVHDEDAEGPIHCGERLAVRGFCRLAGWCEPELESGALADLALNIHFAAMALDGAVNHGKPEPAAALAFCAEKRLQAALPHLLAHPSPGVGNGKEHGVVSGGGAQGEGAAIGHCIDGVENEICEHLPQLVRLAHDLRIVAELELRANLDSARASLRFPARLRERERLLDQRIEIHAAVRLRLLGMVECPEAPHGFGSVLRCRDDDAHLLGSLFHPGGVLTLPEHKFTEAENDRESVVEIMRHAAGHRSQRPEALLLDHLLLRCLEVLQSPAQQRSSFLDHGLQLLAVQARLAVESAGFKQGAHAEDHLGVAERLGEKIVCAA